MGMKKSTIQSIVRADAPSGRRIMSPHSPPVTYCSISTASEPATIENQKRKLGRYARKKVSRLTK
jgi:hypothetical protein